MTRAERLRELAEAARALRKSENLGDEDRARLRGLEAEIEALTLAWSRDLQRQAAST